jgi:hypothetical protein
VQILMLSTGSSLQLKWFEWAVEWSNGLLNGRRSQAVTT